MDQYTLLEICKYMESHDENKSFLNLAFFKEIKPYPLRSGVVTFLTDVSRMGLEFGNEILTLQYGAIVQNVSYPHGLYLHRI